MLEDILYTLTPTSDTYLSVFLLYFNIVIFTVLFPNEIIMFVIGFLVAMGKLNFLALPLVIIANSFIAFLYYLLSAKVKKRYLMHSKKLILAENFFVAHGNSSVFLSRLLPTLRVYISFVAGLVHMNRKQFLIYTLYGYGLLNTLWFSAGYISHFMVKDISNIDFGSFTFYSFILFSVLLFVYITKQFLVKRASI